MFVETAVLLAFSLTIASEVAVVALVQRPKEPWRWVAGVVLVNCFTHPLAIYFLLVGNANLVLVEMAVFVVEALFYRLMFGISWRRAALLSLLANAASLLLGVLSRRMF